MKNIFKFFLITCLLLACGKKQQQSTVSNASCIPNKTLKHFAIYYGYPSSLNTALNNWDMNLVKAEFAHYDSVVLGRGLEDIAHTDHLNTVSLVAAVNGAKFFGYIDIGNTRNLSIAQIKTSIDNWSAMTGLYGMFLDEFGMDYRATGSIEADYRIRQKTILDYVHSKGLKAFLNAWEPDDVFIKEVTNPLTISAGDLYLYESYFLSSAVRETFVSYRSKIAKLKIAKAAHAGLEVVAVSSTSTNSFTQALFDTMSYAAIADELDGIAWGELNYSTTGAMPLRTLPTLVNLYCLGSVASINSSNESLDCNANNSTVNILYNSLGNPSSIIK